jgi:hypothetical protein
LRRLTVSLGSFWRERRFEIPALGYTATGQMSPTIDFGSSFTLFLLVLAVVRQRILADGVIRLASPGHADGDVLTNLHAIHGVRPPCPNGGY